MSEENLIHHTNGILIRDSEGHAVRATPYQRLQLDKMLLSLITGHGKSLSCLALV